MRGVIKNKKKYYGFIEGENNIDYYMNKQSMESVKKWYDLRKGDIIKFQIKQTNKPNNDSATNIKKIDNEAINFFKEKILNIDDAQYDKFCDLVKIYALKLKVNKVTTSKIRKVYSNILNADKTIEIKKLRPQFAYLAGRNEKNMAMKEFMDLLDFLVQKIEIGNKEQLDNLKQFMEAVVAYRKYAGKDI